MFSLNPTALQWKEILIEDGPRNVTRKSKYWLSGLRMRTEYKTVRKLRAGETNATCVAPFLNLQESIKARLLLGKPMPCALPHP